MPTANPAQVFQVQKDITLVPTPILLVHGLWGKADDWKEFKCDLSQQAISQDLVVWNVDYSAYSARWSLKNTWVIPRNSASLVVQCRNNGYAATRVDVAAHSMGGILTRIACNLPDYRALDNFNDGYIWRVVTVDTPHHGAPTAPFLLAYLGAFTDLEDLAYRQDILYSTGKDPCKGAVSDPNPYTFAGGFKVTDNGAVKSIGVPAHTIYCEATLNGEANY